MNAKTKNMIAVLANLFKEREKVPELSTEYATLTADILWIEKALQDRGVDTFEILWSLANEAKAS
jgi:hypothetical protein